MNIEEQMQFIKDNCPALTHHVSKRNIRHSFFKSIDTEIQAYLLGFHAADGSIDEKRKTFRVQLSEKDSEIIYLFRDFISEDARIYHNNGHLINGRHGEIYKQKPTIGIDITSAELAKSLVDLGFGYKKTYKELHLPDIKSDLLRHFLRGYFDGDGCFTCWYVPQNGNRKERVRGRFDIISKNKSILADIQSYLKENDIKSLINYLKRDNMYRLYVESKKEIIKLYHLLYDNSYFYLSRKYNKFNHYVNTEVTQLIAEHRNAQKASVNESNNPSKSAEHPTNEDENVC